MTAMIDETRKYEACGIIKRLPHHKFLKLYLEEQSCKGCFVKDLYAGDVYFLEGAVLFACGGLNGMFGDLATGSRSNTGEAAATAFYQGVEMGNLEFIQFHPTTFAIPGKRCLVSEAARGEGGRLFVRRNGVPWYFLEEKYPRLGNLMPRDIVAREMSAVCKREDCESQVYLDMTEISQTVWKQKLSDLREECRHYLHKDPIKEPVPVEPGIHYFMGGILVDRNHRTNIRNVYAAGECACQYHGANRLGGNSLLGAIYGGKTAAQSVSEELQRWKEVAYTPLFSLKSEDEDMREVRRYLKEGLGLVRSGVEMEQAIRKLKDLLGGEQSGEIQRKRLLLGLAMLRAAYERKESRGAHFRSDYPEEEEACRKTTVAVYDGYEIRMRNWCRDAPYAEE